MFSGWKIKFPTNLALRLLSAWLECRCTTRHSLRKQSLGHARDTPQLLRRSRHNVLFLVRFHIFAVFASTGLPCSLSRSRHVRFHGPAMFASTGPPCSLSGSRRVHFHGPAMFAFRFLLCSLLFSVMFAATFSPCWLPQASRVPLSCSRHVLFHVRFQYPSVFVFMFLLSSFPRSLPGSLNKFTGAIKQQIGDCPPTEFRSCVRVEVAVLGSLS